MLSWVYIYEMQKMLAKLGEIFLIKNFIRTEVKEIKSQKNVFLYFYQLHSCAFTAHETYWVYDKKNALKNFLTTIYGKFFSKRLKLRSKLLAIRYLIGM